MDADGSDAHEILADEPTLVGGGGSLQWSPAGDRIAIQVRSPDPEGINAIYTFAPDGSDFTHVITYGLSPYWSPDGSRIGFYGGPEPFAVDADGTGNVEPIDEFTYSSWDDGSYD